NAANALPVSDEYVFVVRDFQISDYQIDQHLEKYFAQAKIKVLDHLTEGQAVTCMHAMDLIDPENALLIGASDNGMIYNQEKFLELSNQYDALVFTFRNNPAVNAKPEAYGWVKCHENGPVENVSVKVPISPQPERDHAVVRTVWLIKAFMFKEAPDKMMVENRRVNNKFYVDACVND